MAALALLGAWSGFTTYSLSLLPTVYIYYLDKRHHRAKPATAWVFWAILLVGWLMAYSSTVDILALIGSSVYVFSLFQRNENNIRSMLIVNQAAWTSYNLIVGLYTAAFFGFCFIISDIIAIHRFSKGHKKAHRAIKHWWK
jgi:hypothetical protein